jgi:hypothetical protein
MSIINLPKHDLKLYRGDTATTAQSQGVFGFVEKEFSIEWVEGVV